MSAPNDSPAHHSHPVNSTTPADPPVAGEATAAHPPAGKPDPTLESNASQGRLAAAGASASSELASLKVKLKGALRQFPDFPEPGILFEDILPIFADPSLFEALVHALELHIKQTFAEKPDVIVGLDARGFLFGPTLALRLGAAFVPVRKRGKLPGPCETAEYMKEYGADFFQMQADAVKPGQKVLIVDDIIATGECGPFIPSLLGQYADYITRWLRICCGYPRREARRQGHRIRLHPRARLPQGP
jgi:adenine phosphoribosyltransferase